MISTQFWPGSIVHDHWAYFLCSSIYVFLENLYLSHLHDDGGCHGVYDDDDDDDDDNDDDNNTIYFYTLAIFMMMMMMMMRMIKLTSTP